MWLTGRDRAGTLATSFCPACRAIGLGDSISILRTKPEIRPGQASAGDSVNRQRSFAVKNDIAELGGVLDGIRAWCRENSLSEEFAYELNLIVDEVVSNVIRHGYRDGKEHVLKFHLELAGDDLVMEVVDDGVHFNPLIIPPPDTSKPMEERPAGGLGIYLVKNLSDRVEYRRESNNNFLTLWKKIHRV